MDFCLDANVFITPKNLYYPFDFAPAYWDMLDAKFSDGSIYSHIEVYNELSKGSDDLSVWIKAQKEKDWFREQYDEQTQLIYAEIVTDVQSKYLIEESNKFLSGADPWLIATCSVNGSTLVTKEIPKAGKKVTIPNVCKVFGVSYIDDFEMIRQLGSKFIL